MICGTSIGPAKMLFGDQGDAMLKNFVLELAGVLDQEAVLYNEIYNISQNKTSIIMEGKVVELDKIVKLEQSMVMKLGKLEDIRENLVRQIAQLLGLELEELNLSTLTEKLKGEEVNPLKKSQQSLTETITRLKQANDLNAKLIKNSLEYIEFSLNLMTNTNVSTNSYGNTGQVGNAKKRNLFDIKL
jgi:flagellar biosynthesis/type III secretory pathway chaperone